MKKVSAGLLMYRRRSDRLEVLLAHPGGPYFANKDDGAWSIPKGEVEGADDLLATARREFVEEIGFQPGEPFVELGSIKQRGGKVVHAWAFEGDLPANFELCSNSFEIEWPPRSGHMQEFPEIDRAEFFNLEQAQQKINSAQAELLDRLTTGLG